MTDDGYVRGKPTDYLRAVTQPVTIVVQVLKENQRPVGFAPWPVPPARDPVKPCP